MASGGGAGKDGGGHEEVGKHPSTLISMSSLAWTYFNLGRLHEAEQLGRNMMETRKRVLGEEHPDTLINMDDLAATYKSLGRTIEGAVAMETMKRVLGEEHPSTLTSMVNLAATYDSLGRWNESEELGRTVVEV